MYMHKHEYLIKDMNNTTGERSDGEHDHERDVCMTEAASHAVEMIMMYDMKKTMAEPWITPNYRIVPMSRDTVENLPNCRAKSVYLEVINEMEKWTDKLNSEAGIEIDMKEMIFSRVITLPIGEKVNFSVMMRVVVQMMAMMYKDEFVVADEVKSTFEMLSPPWSTNEDCVKDMTWLLKEIHAVITDHGRFDDIMSGRIKIADVVYKI